MRLEQQIEYLLTKIEQLEHIISDIDPSPETFEVVHNIDHEIAEKLRRI